MSGRGGKAHPDALALAAGLAWIVWSVAGTAWAWPLKLALSCALFGALALFLGALRARLHTLPFDPYRDLER